MYACIIINEVKLKVIMLVGVYMIYVFMSERSNHHGRDKVYSLYKTTMSFDGGEENWNRNSINVVYHLLYLENVDHKTFFVEL